jgi:polyribonucleotide nucleotidyltransferase
MIKIESRHVGKVIGPRGATIKELQQQFNVRISIAKENDEVSEKTPVAFVLF